MFFYLTIFWLKEFKRIILLTIVKFPDKEIRNILGKILCPVSCIIWLKDAKVYERISF